MKLPLVFLSALALGCALSAPAQTADDLFSTAQLDQLLGPIALYPDPLVALILPASTVPSDLAQAANYLSANGDPAGIDAQPWDLSVKGLAHYPQAVDWMNSNLDWTEALGAAFAQQPADVMKSIQQLRTQAWASGALVSTPQQTVVFEGDEIASCRPPEMRSMYRNTIPTSFTIRCPTSPARTSRLGRDTRWAIGSTTNATGTIMASGLGCGFPAGNIAANGGGQS